MLARTNIVSATLLQSECFSDTSQGLKLFGYCYIAARTTWSFRLLCVGIVVVRKKRRKLARHPILPCYDMVVIAEISRTPLIDIISNPSFRLGAIYTQFIVIVVCCFYCYGYYCCCCCKKKEGKPLIRQTGSVGEALIDHSL